MIKIGSFLFKRQPQITFHKDQVSRKGFLLLLFLIYGD